MIAAGYNVFLYISLVCHTRIAVYNLTCRGTKSKVGLRLVTLAARDPAVGTHGTLARTLSGISLVSFQLGWLVNDTNKLRGSIE
jgi:hypothetical protein